MYKQQRKMPILELTYKWHNSKDKDTYICIFLIWLSFRKIFDNFSIYLDAENSYLMKAFIFLNKKISKGH